MKYLKLSAIVGLMLLVCVVGLLFCKRLRAIEADSSAPAVGVEGFTEQTSNAGESSGVMGDMGEAGVPRIEPPATASKTNDNHIVAASMPHQYVEAEESNALATNATPDSGHSEINADESSVNKSKVEEESVQDIKIYINAAHADLEAKNVPVGERTATTSIQGDKIIVTFSPKPGERAGDFIVRVDRSTGKVIDTKIWR